MTPEILKLATYEYSLPLGRIMVQFPCPLPGEQLDLITEWFGLIVKGLPEMTEAKP